MANETIHNGAVNNSQPAALANTEPAALADPRPIETITTEILYLKSKAGEAIIEIGKRLIEAKAQLEHGEWLPWLEDKVGFSDRSAQGFMRIAKEFPNPQPVADLGVSKALQILALPPSDREAFLEEKHEVDGVEKTAYEMTRKELQEAIKAKQNADAKLDELKTKSEKEEKRLRMAITDREAQIESLKAENEKLKAEPKTVTAVETVRDTEAEDKLKKKIEKLQDELKDAKDETDAYRQTSERHEKASADLRAEIERMKKAQTIGQSPKLAEFKAYFDFAQDAVNQMRDCISEIGKSDRETARKLATAAQSFVSNTAGMFASLATRLGD